jgi:hypothetical protein
MCGFVHALSAQPKILSASTLDLASDPIDWLAAVKGSLASIQEALRLLLANQNPPSASTPAPPAQVLGPDFLALHPAAKMVSHCF